MRLYLSRKLERSILDDASTAARLELVDIIAIAHRVVVNISNTQIIKIHNGKSRIGKANIRGDAVKDFVLCTSSCGGLCTL